MIKLESFSKSYRNVAAVKDVSFTVPDCSITGLLGSNGAGKSTILKAVCAIHFPTDGSVSVNSIQTEENPVAVKQITGFVGEFPVLYEKLSVRELLHFCADLRFPGMRRTEKNQHIGNVIDMFALSDVCKQKAGALSKGYKQRLSFALALMHNPPVLVLDEPSSGLDPKQIHDMHRIIREFGKTKTILLSSHSIQESESLCSNLVIIEKGSVVAAGSTETVKAAAGVQTLEEAFLKLTARTGAAAGQTPETL